MKDENKNQTNTDASAAGAAEKERIQLNQQHPCVHENKFAAESTA